MENEERVQKNLRLPKDLIEQISAVAKEKDFSFNKVVIDLLRKGLEK